MDAQQEHDVELELILRCCTELGIGSQQVVSEFTRDGLGRRDPSDTDKIAVYLRKHMPSIGADTIHAFFTINETPSHVSSTFLLDDRFLILSDNEMRRIFKNDDGWEQFRKKYPDSRGTMSFSRVGFGRNDTEALLCTGVQYDWLAGHGDYWLFRFDGDKWNKAGTVMSWIS